MLDEFVQTVYEKSAKEERTAKLASAMEALPTDELKKIARFGMLGDGEGEPWINKYKGSSIFDQAMQLEQQYLQLELQQNEADAQRQQSWGANDQLRGAQDSLCVQKRMMDLQLAAQQHQQGADAEVEMAAAEAEEAAAPPPPGPPGEGDGAAPPAAEGATPAEGKPPAAEKPPEEKKPEKKDPSEDAGTTTVSVKKASANMCAKAMKMRKEALSLSRVGKAIGKAYTRGGVRGAASRAGRIGVGLAKKNPLAAAGVAAGAAGAAGVGAGFIGGRASK